jgi:adenylate cyclase
MLTKDDIITGVDSFFEGEYEIIEGRTIPNVEDIQLGKHGRELELAMLFIDIRESTKIVDGFRRITSARMYKSFLWGITKIARDNDGELRSFNGDGVLVAFSGEYKCTNATKAALQMSWFCQKILKPKVEEYFENNLSLEDLDFEFGIGIHVGNVLVVRGGIRGDNNNDLVWVGNATNFSVKLSSLCKEGYHVYISADVYKRMGKSSKYGGDPEKNMWEARVWKDNNDMDIYRSRWTWAV